MISDRPYLRDDKRETISVLNWLISAIIAGFILQIALGSRWLNGGEGLNHHIALSLSGLEAGRVWTLVTYSFLHSPRFIFHGICNVLALYFLGRELLPLLGARRLLGIYGLATAAGGLAWAAVQWKIGGADILVGATAAVYAFIVIFACFFPQKELRFWLFFLVPVSLKPRHIVYVLAGFDFFLFLSYEVSGVELPFDMMIASSAHLAGMATGFLYYRFFHQARWLTGRQRRADIELPRWVQQARKSGTAPAPCQANVVGSRADIRAEVDRILDKINSDGFAALTPEEKRVLDDAKHVISRR